MSRVQDAISVRHVFGEPYTSDGVMVIPVASVGAGAGGGSGDDAEHGTGEGGGFGGGGRPIGAYVVRDGEVTFRPAIDANRAIMWGSLVLLGLFLLVSRTQRLRAKGGRGRRGRRRRADDDSTG